jgi:carboxylesterase type B
MRAQAMVGLSTAALIYWALYSAGVTPVAVVGDTTIRGRVINGVGVFLGIPYGRIPYRFARSQMSPLPLTVDALAFGPACPQGGSAGEDEFACLSLNVWAPARASGLPVVVAIHGGGFVFGASSGEIFNGTWFANSGIVYVSLNYRLGPVGFLQLDDSGAGGMNGILDQRLALQWVARNVAAFGGDPDRITVMGQSAGAMSTCVHVARPPAGVRIRAAALFSGFCARSPWGPNTLRFGGQAARSLARGLKVASVDDLRTVPVAKLVWDNLDDPSLSARNNLFQGYFEDPTVDITIKSMNDFYFGSNTPLPTQLLVTSTNADSLVLSASTDAPRGPAEYAAKMDAYWGATGFNRVNMSTTGCQQPAAGGEVAAAYLQALAPGRILDSVPTHAFFASNSDLCIGCPFVRLAQQHPEVSLAVFAHLMANGCDALTESDASNPNAIKAGAMMVPFNTQAGHTSDLQSWTNISDGVDFDPTKPCGLMTTSEWALMREMHVNLLIGLISGQRLPARRVLEAEPWRDLAHREVAAREALCPMFAC